MKKGCHGVLKGAVVLVLGLLLIAPAQASIKEMKAYKEAYPDAKVKCIDCHKDAMPKKDDGQHDMNDYGLAVIAEAQKEAAAAAAAKEEVKPTVDTYKAVGKIEDFVKKEEVQK